MDGGVPSSYRLIDSTNIYTNSIVLIWCLLDSAREHIIQVGGVELIIRNIQQHAAEEQLTEYALFTLGNLSIHGTIFIFNTTHFESSFLFVNLDTSTHFLL